ncbi:MAG: hypothetical protein KKF93_03960 [Candidatus Omnitrophica bacterium]|nr:hypothetical protein [Candidatus Omnitrophota bacterium]
MSADYIRLSEHINEAKDLTSLGEAFVNCLNGGISEEERKQLLELVKEKIKQLKKTDKELLATSRKSMHSEQLAAMGQMAAAISHELKNPLSGIRVAADYLIRKVKNQPDVLDIINNINNEVAFANSIIANILEHAKVTKPDFQPTNLKQLIEEAILTVAQHGWFNNIEIKKNIPNNLPRVELDKIQIRQVFMNLFINSAEAMVGGGVLEIGISQEAQTVQIQIGDTGVGIEEEKLEKIFEPFFSTKVKGIGLGLAITKEIIEKHDGEIEVKSKPTKGATFIIKLPISRKDSKENG